MMKSLLSVVITVIVAAVACGADTQPSNVLAKVGDRTLTREKLDAFKTFFQSARTSDEQLIEQWKINAALANRAEQEGMLDDPEIKNLFEFLRTGMIAGSYLKYKQSNISVTDKDIKEWYDAHGDSRDLRDHDFVTIKLIVAEDRETIEKIKDRIKAGETLDDLVKEFEAQTRRLTGLPSGMMEKVSTKALEAGLGQQVVYALRFGKTGVTMGPRRTTKGHYALAHVVERTQGPTKPLAEVEDQIRTILLRQKRMELMKELRSQAMYEAGVERKSQRRQGQQRKGIPVTPKKPTAAPGEE